MSSVHLSLDTATDTINDLLNVGRVRSSGHFEGERVGMPFPLLKNTRTHGNGVPVRSGGFGGKSTDVN